MPLVDLNDASLWDGGPASLYRDGAGRGYVREAKQAFLGNDHYIFADALKIQRGQSIILVGAGFGWVAEDWEQIGLGPILALDTSAYIQARLENAAVHVMNADVGGISVRKMFGINKAHWCISEDVIGCLTDEEAVALAQRMRKVAQHVVHWTSCGVRRFDDPNVWAGDPRLNWKTAEDWKRLLAPDVVVARNEMSRVL